MAGQPTHSPASIEQIRIDLASTDQVAIGRAIHYLVILVKKDVSIHPEALGYFEHWAQASQDSYIAHSAAHGIEAISGQDAFRQHWGRFLQSSNSKLVKYTVQATTDPFFLPTLLQMLAQNPEPMIRSSLLRRIGQMKDPSVLPILISHLSTAEFRPDALSAIHDLGDPRAIEHLKPFLSDKTDLWQEDNHGPMVRVCDFVKTTIAELSKVQSSTRARWGEQAERTLSSQGVSVLPDSPAPIDPATIEPAKFNWIAFAPLAAAGVAMVLFFLVVIQILKERGQASSSTTRGRDLLILLPALAGLVCGYLALLRFARLSLLERIFLIVGLVVCLLISFGFGYEMLHQPM